eukprot:gene12096-2206_t
MAHLHVKTEQLPWVRNNDPRSSLDFHSRIIPRSVRRGHQVFREVFAPCHGLKYLTFRDWETSAHLLVADLSTAARPSAPRRRKFMTPMEVKEFAQDYECPDTPAEDGSDRMRPCNRADMYPSPFKNKEQAMFSNNGAVPPDLSLMAYARGQPNSTWPPHGRWAGWDYLFNLLTSYGREPPAGVEVPEGKHFNPYFEGGVIGMPPPLNDGMIEYEDGTPAT